MIKNYFKIAWRNLVRNKAFSCINICGLGLGLACSLLIFLWVQDERNVDAFHVNGPQLFQVYERDFYEGKVVAGYATQGLLAEALTKDIPEITHASGFERAAAPGALITFEANDKINKMEGSFAGADFFSMFSFPLLQGSPKTALNTLEGIAISRKMAEQFFGNSGLAMGKMIRYENKEDVLVTAVFENIPINSSIQFDFLRSWKAFVRENKWVNNWSNTSPATLVQLHKDADPLKTEAKIKDFIYRYKPKEAGSLTELALQSFPDKYLNASFRDGRIDGGRIGYVRLFTLVAVFVLLIACINFMNLATARSVKRSKEVGLRKVIGANRSLLVYQFIGEAFLLTFFAVLLALLIAILLMPAFNELTAKSLSLPVSQPLFWTALLGLLLITGLVAGSYPAFFLSSFNPVKVLKGSHQFSRGATFFRKGLVVFQFSLSILLIIGMMVIYRQVNFIQTTNIGYNRENLVYIPIEGELKSKYGLFKDELSKLPGILSVSKMRNSPTVIEHHTGSISWPGKAPGVTVPFADGIVGYDFARTLDLSIIAGRDFSKDFVTDTANFIVNETAVKKLGYTNPIGKPVSWGNRNGTIIGVLKDFHFNSMHEAIDPLILHLDENWSWGTILIRTQAGKTREAIAGLGKICKSMNPKFPFVNQFSDEAYTRLYQSEQVVSKLAAYFAALAIFISCLGLFGLATFTATQRTREIGVRKVLGASVAGITRLLAKEFIRLVFIAILVATPVAWWAMEAWLQSYVYKINMSWWIFIAAGLLAITIALITVSFQSIKAALANPVRSLRTE